MNLKIIPNHFIQPNISDEIEIIHLYCSYHRVVSSPKMASNRRFDSSKKMDIVKFISTLELEEETTESKRLDYIYTKKNRVILNQ